MTPTRWLRRPPLADADVLPGDGRLGRIGVASGIARRISKSRQINWCPLRIKLALPGCAVGLTCFCHAAANDPSGHIRKSSWHVSLPVSIEAISRNGDKDGFAPFESETMRGGDAARQISVPLTGAKDLYLFVIGVPDVKWAVTGSADARLFRNNGSAKSLNYGDEPKQDDLARAGLPPGYVFRETQRARGCAKQVQGSGGN